MMSEVEVQIRYITELLVAEAGAKDKFKQVGLVFGRYVEHRYQLFGLVDRADGIDVLGSVTFFHQAAAPMLFEELQHGHDLVVDGASTQPELTAVGHEVEHVIS